MVVKPRCGQPNICSIETNSSSCVMPVMISGITSGAFTMPVNSRRPRNREKRTSAMAGPQHDHDRGSRDRHFQRQQRRPQRLAIVHDEPTAWTLDRFHQSRRNVPLGGIVRDKLSLVYKFCRHAPM
jgi:hypothetical protein